MPGASFLRYLILIGLSLLALQVFSAARAFAQAAESSANPTEPSTSPGGQPGHDDLLEGEEAKVQEAVEEWLRMAEDAIESGHLVEPEGRNAVGYLRQVLAQRPNHPGALAELSRVQSELLQRAMEAAGDMDFELALSWLDEAEGLLEDRSRVEAARERLLTLRESLADDIERDIRQQLDAGEFNRAEIYLIDLVALGVERERIGGLREAIEMARVYGAYEPGQQIRDPIEASSSLAPAVVVIPAGSYMMGARDDEEAGTDEQRPRHRVTIEHGFGMGLTETTVAEFREFIESERYRTTAEIEGYSMAYDEHTGRLVKREGINWRHDFTGKRADDRLPVIHISWDDAVAYTGWLSRVTNQEYRLPSEAEFEYAQRGGSASAYWWGEGSPMRVIENLTGDGDASPRNRNWSVAFENYSDGHWGPGPVGSFEPNPFGLFDMSGNVSEWVTDCWHENYLRAPDDGSAWTNPGCARRVIRGGYWASSPDQVRSAARLFAESGLRGPRVGFRVVREL